MSFVHAAVVLVTIRIWGLVVTFTHYLSKMIGLVEEEGYLAVWYTNLMVVEMINLFYFTTISNPSLLLNFIVE